MKPFSITVGIREYKTFANFAEEFEFSKNDLILTNEYIYKPAIASLGLPCMTVFQEKYGAGEPTDEMIEGILYSLKGTPYDRIIAVGGGTIIDIAKVMAVAGPDDTVDDLYDRMPDIKKVHDLIIVPTTCGTGSEMTNISVISRVKKGVKQGLVSPSMYANETALITDMLMTLPYPVFATSSIDAMIHATESFLSPNACPMSEMYSEKALEMILGCWDAYLKAGGGDAWKNYADKFLLASNYAGIAFGYAGCAAVHALSYPVGSVHHVPHGQANQLMFADVMRKYQEKKSIGKINLLEELIADILSVEPVFAINELCKLMDSVFAKDKLREHGVTLEELPIFAQNVIDTQQRLLNNNYVELTYGDILDIYTKAF